MNRFLLFFLYFSLNHAEEPEKTIGCVDQAGTLVDWFIIYKLPDMEHPGTLMAKEGDAYLFLDSRQPEWKLFDQPLNTTNHPLARTLAHYYDNRKEDDVFHLLYNDEHPDGDTDSYRAHAKGVLLSDFSRGFWLIHSVPKFPPTDAYSYPESGTRYGQSMLCISIKAQQLQEIGEQLVLYQPSIYSAKLPTRLAQLYPSLGRVVGKKTPRKPPYNRRTSLESYAGAKFSSFAKNRKWGKDLYADFLAEEVQTALYTETWLNGPGDLPSVCNQTYPVHNLRAVKPDSISFTNSKDHAKWAVAVTSQRPWICIGDINRQSHQEKRGGGTVCMENKDVWRLFRKAASKVEECGGDADRLVSAPEIPDSALSAFLSSQLFLFYLSPWLSFILQKVAEYGIV